jgi:hypothetical protein
VDFHPPIVADEERDFRTRDLRYCQAQVGGPAEGVKDA